MSEVKNGLYYTKEHEWIAIEEEIVTIGISDYAQKLLGDIVFVDLPGVDDEIKKDDSFGVVESVKAVSDLYSPLTGKVVESNEILTESPELVNEDAYEEAWLIKVEPAGDSSAAIETLKSELMDDEAYKQFLAEEEE